MTGDRYRWGIEAAAMAVHGAVTGSCDWGDADEMAEWLRGRLADWQASPVPTARFDDTVKAMAQAALDEYDAHVLRREVVGG